MGHENQWMRHFQGEGPDEIMGIPRNPDQRKLEEEQEKEQFKELLEVQKLFTEGKRIRIKRSDGSFSEGKIGSEPSFWDDVVVEWNDIGDPLLRIKQKRVNAGELLEWQQVKGE